MREAKQETNLESPCSGDRIGALRVHGGRIEVRLPFGATRSIREKMPGARWDPTARCWHVPATPFYARRVLASSFDWPDDTSFEDLHAIADAAPPPDERGIVAYPRGATRPWEHQRDGAAFCAARQASMLAWEMGTGKTKTIVDLIFGTGVRNALIVAPKAVVGVWRHQIEVHAPRGVRYVFAVAQGGAAKTAANIRRAERLRRDGVLFVVVNYDIVFREPVHSALAEHQWDIVVADESHRIANPQTKSCKALCAISASAPRRVCLTGTPLRNGPLDIFGQAKFLDPGIFGSHITPFRDRYGVWRQFERFRKLVGYQRMDEFRAIYNLFTHTVRKSDVLDLPPVTHTMVPVSMPRDAIGKYRSMAEGYVAEFEAGEVLAQHAATKILRLQQIASGALYDGDADVTHRIHDAKRAALCEILAEAPVDEPVVVFCRFRSCIAQAREAAAECDRAFFEVSGSRNDYEEWRGGSGGSVLAVQVQSGSEGLDLSRASLGVFFTAPFSLAQFEQACARLDRPGQTRPVSIYHLCASGTVDMKIYRALQDKKDVISEVTNDPRRAIFGDEKKESE